MHSVLPHPRAPTHVTAGRMTGCLPPPLFQNVGMTHMKCFRTSAEARHFSVKRPATQQAAGTSA